MKNLLIAVILLIFLSLGKVEAQYNIKFVGNKTFSNNQLTREILFLTFSTAKPADVSRAQEILLNFYEDKGFLLAEVDSRLVHVSNGADSAVFTIREDDRFYLGKIDIIGLQYNRPEFIRKYLQVDKERPLSRSTILEFQEQLNGTAMFDSVMFSVEGFDMSSKRVNLQLVVKERKPYFLGSGFGLDTEDGVKFISEFGHRHFRRAGEMIRMDGFVSFFYTSHLFLKHYRLHLNYLDPIFIWKNLQWSNDLGFETDHPTYVSFSFRKMSLESTWRLMLMENLSAGFGVAFDRVWLYKVTNTVVNNSAIRDRVDQNRQLRWRLSYNNVHSMLNPARGVRAEMMYQYNGGFLGGSNNFHRITMGSTFYFPLGAKTVLALHSQGGWLEGFAETDQVPDYQRFLLGGSHNLRGYRNNRLGPRNNEGKFTGGLVMLYNSMEIRRWLTSRWQLILFLDSGQLCNDIQEIKLNKLVFSAGPGLRYRWRGNLFALDLGFKINQFTVQNPGWIHFGYGQHF